MSVTSANIDDLETFINGSTNRLSRMADRLTRVSNKANVVMPACSGSQYPSTPSLAALNELLTAWGQNQGFVQVVHDELVKANQFNGDGMATVGDAAIDATLKANGLDGSPGVVDVDAVVLYGQPPYSGFVDDPICLANGNFLLRDGDLAVAGVASSLSIVRTYNSRDQRPGVFGPGWTSLVDVALAVEERRITFRGPDGGGCVFEQLDDGTWIGGRRRRLTLSATAGTGWEVREGHERAWRFDAEGTLAGFTAIGADVAVERAQDEVRFADRTSGRWVVYRLHPVHRLVTSAASSDGREVAYERDGAQRLVAARRDNGDVTYEHDDLGFLATVTDADGIVVCRNVYDSAGRVLSQVEQHGRQTSYEYRPDGVSIVTAADGAPPNVMVHDRRGRMTAMIDGLGNTMRIAYDDDDNIVQVVDRTGATTRFEHDERGNVVRRTDPDGLTHQCEWDDLDRLVAEIDRAGGVTRYVYEGDLREPVRLVQADGSEVHLTLDPTGLPTSVTDADGVEFRMEWNRDGLLDVVTDPLGGRITFEYDSAGHATRASSPDGVTASVGVDPAGRVLALRTADGEQAFEYTPAGRLVGTLGPAGTSWRGTLDAAGDLATVRDGAGQVVQLERDTIGQVVGIVRPDGGRARFEHDPVGRRTAIVDPVGNRTELGYDPEGRPVQVTDPSGRSTSREVDVLGRTLMAVAPGGGTSIRSYHPNGELASVSDAAGNEWTYDVDAVGRVVAATDPLGHTTTYRYTAAGRLAEVRSPLGRVHRREYDAAGRLARIIEPDGVEVRFERRGDGAVTTVTRDGVPTTVDYDEGGRAAAIDGPWGTLSTRRDHGVLTGSARDGGAAARFDYDQRGLLQRIVDPAGVVTELTHDAGGRLLAHTTGETTASYTWDASGRLASVTDVYGNQTSFTRDPRGIVDQIFRPDGTATRRSFGADGLLDAAFDLEGNELLRVLRDANGEVTEARTDRTALRMAHDAAGRVTAVATDAGTVAYTWDADGYLVSIGDDSGHRVAIERNDGGRVVGFELGDGQRIEVPPTVALERDEARRIVVDEHGRRFTYDLAGRLASTTVGSRTTTYEYNDLGLLSTERDPDGVRSYRYGLAGELVAQVDQDGVETSFEHDATGRRVREARSDGGQVTYEWDIFGRLAAVTRVRPDGTSARDEIEHDPSGLPVRVNGAPILWDSACTRSLLGIGDERFLWSGNQVRSTSDPAGEWSRRVGDDPWGVDGGTGLRLGYRGELALDDLVFLGARVYDTRTRSFLSRDPLPSVPGAVTYAGVYGYAWCDPVNNVDPTGERPLSDEEYESFREQASKGIFRKAVEAVANDPWKYLAKAAIIVGSIVVMTVATATMGPVGLIVAGAVVGALSNGLNTALDGGSVTDIATSALVGGVFGGATAGLSRFLPTSALTPTGARVAQNAAYNGAIEYPMAFASEGANALLTGNPYSVTNALINGTSGTIAGVGGAELNRATDPGSLSGILDGETPSSLLPDPARNTVLDINSASVADLERVPGIGPTLAQRIVDQRNANGGYTSTQDLLDIDQLGPARLEAINNAGGIAL